MEMKDIKTPQDVLEFMKTHIKYGWLDQKNEEHIGTMEGFRTKYRTSSLEETLQHGIGTCIEQVFLMNYLLREINIPTKMFCTRLYEGEDFNNPDADEHMHCFLLYYIGDKVYQIEHPNWERVGIYEFDSEEDAINKINQVYIEMAEGQPRPVTEFHTVEPNLSFKQLNGYINSLDKPIQK